MCKKDLLIILPFLLFSSCSLKYDEVVEVDEKIPEFIFDNIKMSKYENNALTTEFSAGSIEQYRNTNMTFAKNVSFYVYDDEKIMTEGKCDLLFSNADSNIYELFDNIEISNYSEKMKFFANALRWNEKTEQMTGSSTDIVKIEKEQTVISGTGFAASGITKKFTFSGSVTGDIETQ